MKADDINRMYGLESWQKEQLKVISIIEELETENRMLRTRNERLTMAMKKMERILQENLR